MTPQEFNTLVIERLQVGLRALVSPSLLRDVNAEAFVDAYTRQIEHQFMMYLWSNTVKTERQYVNRPVSWWDWFKLSYFPTWLMRRFPVRYRQDVEVTKHIHVCPHLNYQTREEERFHLQWLMPEGQLTRQALDEALKDTNTPG